MLCGYISESGRDSNPAGLPSGVLSVFFARDQRQRRGATCDIVALRSAKEAYAKTKYCDERSSGLLP